MTMLKAEICRNVKGRVAIFPALLTGKIFCREAHSYIIVAFNLLHIPEIFPDNALLD